MTTQTPGDEPAALILDDAERNIIIAALRLWQWTATIPSEVMDIASDHGGLFLSDEEIDDLIEGKINV